MLQVRLIVIALLVFLAVYFVLRVLPRLWADPRWRYMLRVAGPNLLRGLLLRRVLLSGLLLRYALPLLSRAFRLLRLFR